MNANLVRAAGYLLVALVACGPARTEPLAAARLAPDEVKWENGQAGVQRAHLVGDEKKPGMYAYRVRFPANHKVQPHFHPDERVVTVLSGTLYVGFGEVFDESAMKPLPAGSIWTEPVRQPHFVFAKDGEVVFQVVGGNGPSGVTRIEPK